MRLLKFQVKNAVFLYTSGTCECDPGFGGADCSVNTTVAPDVWFLENAGLCDLSDRRCNEVAVFGATFILSDNLKCKLTRVKVRKCFLLVCTINYF